MRLCKDYKIVFTSLNGKEMSCYSPYILPLKSGGLLVSMDICDWSADARYCRELKLECW